MGVSRLRSLSAATVSQRQLHESEADMMTTEFFAARPCGMEARGEPRYRTQVNPCAGWSGQGKCAHARDALYPTVAGTVVGAAIAGHFSSLPQEISTGSSPFGGGREHAEATTHARLPRRSRITP